ncbi:MAG: RNA polymerase sigma-70 factor [Bacteroidota bacterium]
MGRQKKNVPKENSQPNLSLIDTQQYRDQALVEQIKNDNVHSFELIFKSHYRGLVHFALQYVSQQAAAEEVVQNLFVTLWENRKSWTLRFTLRSYLYGATRNQALNYIRQARSIDRLDEAHLSIESPLHETPSALLQTKDFSAAIHKAIQTLPERSRLIFLLHRDEGLTYREISSILNISVNTVETQMVRTLKKLRRLLSQYLPVIFLMLITNLYFTL